MESVEDIRRWKATQSSSGPDEAAKNAAVDPALPFRPINRPPLALICLIDDGKDTGEWIRVRVSRVVIGRTDGDILIPFDSALSGQHVEVCQGVVNGRVRWYVRDLQSSNGTFARVNAARLEHGQEILVGGRRFRFEGPEESSQAGPAPTAARQSTRGWQTLSMADRGKLNPSVVELTPAGEGSRVFLTQNEHWIGLDAGLCTIVVQGDPFVSPQHARLHRDAQGHWHIENGKSRNGTWLRISETIVESSGDFQAGEQRFLVRVLDRDNPTSS